MSENDNQKNETPEAAEKRVDDQPAPVIPPPAAEEPATEKKHWARSPKVIAGVAAAAVFLVGGASGFAVGRGTADDRGDRAGFARDFRDGQGPDRRGFGGGPGGGPDIQMPPGTAPESENQDQVQPAPGTSS